MLSTMPTSHPTLVIWRISREFSSEFVDWCSLTQHTTALPCEITIYNDEDAIYVDMLNPETIFTLFFTEVFDSVEMDNLNFATEMLALPSKVKSEIFAMIYNAFDGNNETYTETAIKMGPIYSSMSAAKATTDTANKEIIGKINSGDFPIKINTAEISATADIASTSRKSFGVATIR